MTANFGPNTRVPPEGMQSWARPDPSGAITPLAGGLELAVIHRVGDWAQVQASNGWIGWVDARRLVPLAAPPPPPPSVQPQAQTAGAEPTTQWLAAPVSTQQAPQAQWQQPAPAARKGLSTPGKIIIGALVVLIVILVAAMPRTSPSPLTGGNGGNGGNGGGGGGGSRSVGLNQPARVEDAEITILEGTYSRGLEYQEPAAGHVFIAYKVRIRAVDDDVFVSASNWTALADGSRQGQWTYTVNDAWDPALTFDTLRQGATTEGWLVFEVPNPSSYVRLVYDPTLFGPDVPQLTIDMNCCN